MTESKGTSSLGTLRVEEGELQRRLLEREFAQFDAASPGLSRRMMQYLMDGTDEESLLVPQTFKTDQWFRFHAYGGTKGQSLEEDRAELFASLKGASPEFFRRLGNIFMSQLSLSPSDMGKFLGGPRLAWLEILCFMSGLCTQKLAWAQKVSEAPFSAAEFVGLLAFEDQPPELLVRAIFCPSLTQNEKYPIEVCLAGLAGLSEVIQRYEGEVRAVLRHAKAPQRTYAIDRMGACGVPWDGYLEELVMLATDSSKEVRAVASRILLDSKLPIHGLLRDMVSRGPKDKKLLAIELVWRLEGESAREFLRQRAAEEKNSAVIQAIEGLLVVADASSASPVVASFELPPRAPLDLQTKLGAETWDAWVNCFEEINRWISHSPGERKIPEEIVRQVFESMRTGQGLHPVLKDVGNHCWEKEVVLALRTFMRRPEVRLIHVLRFLKQAKELTTRPGEGVCHSRWLAQLLPDYFGAHPTEGLRELEAALSTVGIDSGSLALGILQYYQDFGLPADRVWPFWVSHIDALKQALAQSTAGSDGHYISWGRHAALRFLAAFPTPPEVLLPDLWKLALGPKIDRALAQKALENAPDKLLFLLRGVAQGNSDARRAAAEWLGRLGDRSAVGPLMTELKKTKDAALKVAFMAALERLGESPDQFLDPATLLRDAEKGVAKGIPEGLAWFRFDSMPAVSWEASGDAVEPVILKGWLSEGFRLKDPVPDALLRAYCGCLRPAQREALGQFVLEAWIAQDLAPAPPAECEEMAKVSAEEMLEDAKNFPKSFPGPLPSLEELRAKYLAEYSVRPAASAIASKGILSLAGACAGAAAVESVGRYLKDWYGTRAAQCRALIQMLAWVQHPSAVQLLIGVGNRFRTKSIQEEAQAQIRALSERKGWTLDELSDRTIPTAGLDDHGVLALDYGPRQFRAELTDSMTLVLKDSEGQILKSLPEPRRDDDPTKTGDAKKSFAGAKKAIQVVIGQQKERLYEAMCTQRAWRVLDWQTYLNRHPIAGRLCQRLIWRIEREGGGVTYVRPMADGTLTTVEDEPVMAEDRDSIRLAHESDVTPEDSSAWLGHLEDYRVEPMFTQFGRSRPALAESERLDSVFKGYCGYLVETFRLRARATKLGYTRGPTEDGGWFYTYRKHFPSLRLEALIEFTGNALPEQNRTVALKTLSFQTVTMESPGATSSRPVLLGEVPTVLFTECWNDLRQLAAEGTGYEPEWEAKIENAR